MSRPGRVTPMNGDVSIVYDAVWVPRSVWTGVENLPLTEIRSLDRPYIDYAILAHKNILVGFEAVSLGFVSRHITSAAPTARLKIK